MTKPRHFIIYVPGLGDNYDNFRRFALKFWQIWGVRPQLVAMQWDKNRQFDDRFRAVASAIESAKKQGYTVTLIGESAGASMAINVASQVDVHRIITICGTVNPLMKIAPTTLRRSPGFGESMENMAHKVSGLDIKNIHTISALVDKIVASKYSRIPGANNHIIFSVGHLFTVTLCLTFLSGYVIRLVKK